MSRKQKPAIAICYDFDGTLIRGNMQENSFIPDLGIDKSTFWAEVNEHAARHDMDQILAYMQLMLEKAREKDRPFNKKSLGEHGKSIKFFSGVQDWFRIIRQYTKEIANIEHYIISSGLEEMIEGSEIGKNFKHIFASGFVYDANDVAVFPARSINYTTKVQYLFRINKGIENSWDNSRINEFTPESRRPIPFSQMIYIGDGDTDVPAMKMMNHKGGYSIAVYPAKQGTRMTREESERKKSVEKLHRDNRCQFIAEANYSKGEYLYQLVTSLIDRIVNECSCNMNLKANK